MKKLYIIEGPDRGHSFDLIGDSIDKPYGFRKEDLSLIKALSSLAAIAIENAIY